MARTVSGQDRLVIYNSRRSGIASPRGALHPMATQLQRKQQTRQRLIEAALTLVHGGRSFASLGLREVTRAAGISPAAFYLHFRDLDEFGLAIVDDVCLSLRRVLREVRRATPGPNLAAQSSVAYIVEFVKSYRREVEFAVRGRVGGSVRMRRAISQEVRYFAGELAHDLRTLETLSHLGDQDLEVVAQLLVDTGIGFITDLLDLPSNQPSAHAAAIGRVNFELRLILVGARNWDPARAQAVAKASTRKRRAR